MNKHQSKNKHEGCFRAFIILSEAYYGNAVRWHNTSIDEILIGMYDPKGGTTGEFFVRWVDVNGPTPRLEAFNDSWSALQQFTDLLEWMATVDGQRVSPQEFAEKLRQLGIKDETVRINPYTPPGEREYASWFLQGSAA